MSVTKLIQVRDAVIDPVDSNDHDLSRGLDTRLRLKKLSPGDRAGLYNDPQVLN